MQKSLTEHTNIHSYTHYYHHCELVPVNYTLSTLGFVLNFLLLIRAARQSCVCIVGSQQDIDH